MVASYMPPVYAFLSCSIFDWCMDGKSDLFYERRGEGYLVSPIPLNLAGFATVLMWSGERDTMRSICWLLRLLRAPDIACSSCCVVIVLCLCENGYDGSYGPLPASEPSVPVSLLK